MKDNCSYLDVCPIFTRFSSEGIKNVWIGLYCKGPNMDKCARRILRDNGEEVEITLLPNGKHLDDLEK